MLRILRRWDARTPEADRDVCRLCWMVYRIRARRFARGETLAYMKWATLHVIVRRLGTAEASTGRSGQPRDIRDRIATLARRNPAPRAARATHDKWGEARERMSASTE